MTRTSLGCAASDKPESELATGTEPEAGRRVIYRARATGRLPLAGPGRPGDQGRHRLPAMIIGSTSESLACHGTSLSLDSGRDWKSRTRCHDFGRRPPVPARTVTAAAPGHRGTSRVAAETRLGTEPQAEARQTSQAVSCFGLVKRLFSIFARQACGTRS